MSELSSAVQKGVEESAEAVKEGDTAKAGLAIAIAAANAIGAATPPVGPIVALIVDAVVAIAMFFASICKGDPPSAAEAKRIWLDHEDAIHNANNFMKAFKAGTTGLPAPMLDFIRDRGILDGLEALAATPSGFVDPVKLVANQTYRVMFISMLCVRTGVCMKEEELIAEVKKRFPPGSPPLTAAFVANPSNLAALQATVRTGKPLPAALRDFGEGLTGQNFRDIATAAEAARRAEEEPGRSSTLLKGLVVGAVVGGGLLAARQLSRRRKRA